MRIRITGGVGDLAADMAAIPPKAAKRFATAVRKNAEQGNRTAAAFARQSAGAHGKHYHRAFSAEAITPFKWEYGPDASKPQGGMSFEGGSRNQPPHNDLAKSADKQGPKFGKDAADALDGLFW